jgi:hypothetical protein
MSPGAENYDVFLSYAREDSARASFVNDQLEALGLSVFFDTEGIDSGEEFPIVIDRAVKGAKCVLGLWSRAALEKRWVRIESRIGLDQRKLVAAVIDGTRPDQLPAEFYNVNIEDLSSFSGQPDHAGWQRVLRAIGKRVGRRDLAALGTTSPGAPPPPGAAFRAPTSRSALPWLWVGGAVLLAAVAFVMLRPNGASQPVAPPQVTASAKQPALDPAAEKAAQLATEQDRAAREADRMEEMRVRGACEADSLAACRTYLAQYPQGAFATRAKAKVAELERPAAVDLSGQWIGRYEGGGNRPTPFIVTISGAAGRFRGQMTEQNTFAEQPAARLYANIAGETRPDGRVVFVKTYDGTANVSHSVRYEGRIDESGRVVTGEWRIENTRGAFRMERN